MLYIELECKIPKSIRKKLQKQCKKKTCILETFSSKKRYLTNANADLVQSLFESSADSNQGEDKYGLFDDCTDIPKIKDISSNLNSVLSNIEQMKNYKALKQPNGSRITSLGIVHKKLR